MLDLLLNTLLGMYGTGCRTGAASCKPKSERDHAIDWYNDLALVLNCRKHNENCKYVYKETQLRYSCPPYYIEVQSR